MGWFKKGNSGNGAAGPTMMALEPAYIAPTAGKAKLMLTQEEVEPSESHDVYEDERRDDDFVMDRRGSTARSPRSYHNVEMEGQKSYSTKGDDSEAPVLHHEIKAGHLNSLFNGHLMKWKLEAEEGNAFIRVPAFLGALALMSTAITALVLYPDAWEPSAIVTSCGVIVMSCTVLILDGRFLITNPLSARAHLRNVMTRNFNIFRFVWGRGLLYIIAGILNCAQMSLITICSGVFMIALGLIALCVGIHASQRFSSLRNSLADESFLLFAFGRYDNDGDGYLGPNEFGQLLSELGMELDDRYTLKAFNVIDTDCDRKICFDEFNYWWASGYIERGRTRRYSEDEDYQQME
jgi:hypothetical protein